MALPNPHPIHEATLFAYSPSVGGSPITAYTVAPFQGRVTKVSSVIGAAIATADATASLTIAGAAVTGGAITITQAASAAGQVNTAAPTAANTCNEGDALAIAITGSATGSNVPCMYAIQIRRGTN